MLSSQDIEQVNRILKRIVPSIMLSVQNYNPDQELREGIVIGIPGKKKGFNEMVYTNIENITPWQLKTFDTMVKKFLPNKSTIEQHGTITRIIFK
ncbi:hypothetical protein MW871_14955 [Flavobacterium sp. I-SCBP12n]|uniref:Uncharacterized protein n=1 Tax=Flavobacterium pygoscelis TaxID=2893176 RepID=A0A9X1Y0T7_9FLAO|nr:hypothetical protein [Flavobacterium pygoscelis]MCK8143187.1 hypothetical protein [Flavobacterium pygoscelis]